jgi:hypothetical protein
MKLMDSILYINEENVNEYRSKNGIKTNYKSFDNTSYRNAVSKCKNFTKKIMNAYYGIDDEQEQNDNKKRKRSDESDEDEIVKKQRAPDQYCFIGTNWCTSKKCIKDIKLIQEVGGYSGKSYSACLNNECKYVLKAQLLDKNSEAGFQRESFITELASKENIGPVFKESYICGASGQADKVLGLIIVDKWDKGLYEYIIEVINANPFNVTQKDKEFVLSKLSAKLKKLLALGIWIKLEWDNVVLKYDNGKVVDVAITDYFQAFAVKGKTLSAARKFYIEFERKTANALKINSKNLDTLDAEDSSIFNYVSSFFSRSNNNNNFNYPDYVYE